MDEMDKLLNFAGSLDLITPTWAFIQDFLNGPVGDFGIPAHAGWGSRDIKRLLKKNGVHVWGLMLNPGGDMLMFTVRKAQVKWAYYLLERAGVPILYAPAEAVNSSQRWPQKKAPATTSFDSVSNFFDKVDSGLDKLG